MGLRILISQFFQVEKILISPPWLLACGQPQLLIEINVLLFTEVIGERRYQSSISLSQLLPGTIRIPSPAGDLMIISPCRK